MQAFRDQEVFYYQGTKLIGEVEASLKEELKNSWNVLNRNLRISGQMANAAVFSGLTDYLNRMDRKAEPWRIRR
jgi:glycine/serine hydroxymethyltransferase